ncbi:MAG: alpha-glucuronidase family glycosyl hydrolase [Terracidiphilus sp.]|nr:alpha-glucuronidase family glycosyl hydrolase [Terracidiphilus sp.]
MRLLALPLACALTCACLAASAQTADQAWLNYRPLPNSPADQLSVRIRTLDDDPLVQSAATELRTGILGLSSANRVISLHDTGIHILLGTFAEVQEVSPALASPHPLAPEGYWIKSAPNSEGRTVIAIAGADTRGTLYGAFAFLRALESGSDLTHLDILSAPVYQLRWLDHWDNADGTIERGYAGPSLFFESGHVREDLGPVHEYARLLASIGINAINLNNVNNAAPFLDPEMLRGLARIAEVLRPYGVRIALSVDTASPQKIGGLATFDPLDPAVRAWWSAKADEIYSLIPDFAGFTVKADSEGQPGPASYGRTPADAANTLAAALAPHDGVVLYRAFVYNHHLDWRDPHADRARAAYDIFHPLDGKFAANVIVQIKEGPIDFQAREPVSPLFAGLPATRKAVELQITQEYTGQQRHLVYLAPMWKQVLDTGLRSSPALVQALIAQNAGGIVGVAGVGRDRWLAAPLALANLYAFGRLAWNPALSPADIAEEWTRQTLGNDPQVVRTVVDMLLKSWPAYESYTGPLGLQTLTDITGSHYGPNIESSENNGWGQWHRADHDGVGMDRSVSTGTGYAGQYPPESAAQYESAATTPDDLVLFFHHLPYTTRLHSGKTIIQTLYDTHYDGAAQAAQFVRDWDTLQSRIDPALFADVRARLVYQAGHAIVWRDAIVQYFFKLSGIPDEKGRAGNFPGRLEAEAAHLTGYKIIDVAPWEDASRGKAVSCPAPSPNADTALLGTNLGAPGASLLGTRESKPAAKPQPGPVSGHDFSRADTTPTPEGGLQPPSTQRSCTAEWTYVGPAGRYDIALQYFDIANGTARFTFSVNAKNIGSWAADAALPTSRPHGDNSTRHTLTAVEVHPGDVLRVAATPDGPDAAALDYIELTPTP